MLCPAPGRAVSGQRGRGFENLGGTALRPESQRFRYTAWSADYGNELTLLLGGCVDQGILESQVRQYVRDALLVCPYIREVDGFSFSKKGSRVEARFTVHTVYEEFTQKTEVSIR